VILISTYVERITGDVVPGARVDILDETPTTGASTATGVLVRLSPSRRWNSPIEKAGPATSPR